MLAITNGELSVIRTALEEGDAEDRKDALEIVNAIVNKNVKVFVTESRMYQAMVDGQLTEEELSALTAGPLDVDDLEEEDLDLEEECRTC